MTSSLVGSEMCIRDRCHPGLDLEEIDPDEAVGADVGDNEEAVQDAAKDCLLYTSDAADDM
eukprot:5807631-Prorocentrum_lima.AAC.1